MICFKESSFCFKTPLVSLFLQVLLLQQLWTAYSGSFMHSDVAAQLSKTNFTSVLGAMEVEQVCLVEFYASWCPACKHFAPTFEKLATFLKNKRLGGRLLCIARVDCASEAELCGQFDLSGYPSLFLGRAPDFAAKERSKLQLYEGHDRELSHLAGWVGKYFKTELKYSEAEVTASIITSGISQGGAQQAIHQQQQQLGGDGAAGHTSASTTAVKRRPLPNGPEWSLADVEGATLQLWTIMATTPRLHRGADKRAALLGLLQGWAAAHPSPSCKAHSAALVSSYDVLWPPGEAVAPAALLRSEPCGPPARLAYRGEWVTCKGSLPDSRGYSCGLWHLLHAMALRLPDKPGAAGPAQAMMTFLGHFNGHFFLCEPCQRHFGRILASPEAAAVTNRRALALWLWRVHNEVNERLRGIESRYGHSTTGDPAFPKEQWPAPESCPLCRTNVSATSASAPAGSVSWDEDRVWEYLQRVFGVGSVPGADGVKLGGRQLQLGKGQGAARARTASSFLSSMLPVLGVVAAAMLLFLVLRGTLAATSSGAGRRGGRAPGGGGGGSSWGGAK